LILRRGDFLSDRLSGCPHSPDIAHIEAPVGEIARHMLNRGEVALCSLQQDGNRGIALMASDSAAGSEGFMSRSFPTARQLMDEFVVNAREEEGATAVVTKWLRLQ
jgi:hypothetical protein